MPTKIKGGPELRARLASVAAASPEMQQAWAKDARDRIKSDAPTSTGRGRASIREGVSRGRGAVFGMWYLIFIDRGTKAHAIVAKRAKALKFEWKGRTIFAKSVKRRRMQRKPFITENAQAALAGLPIQDQIIQAWNRKRASGRFSKSF